MKRQGDFIGQVNNVLCFFRQQASAVKYRLFCSYCTSLYGCELWQLSHNKLADFSTTWRYRNLRLTLTLTKVPEKSGNCPPEPIAIYSLCYVDVYQSKMKSVSDLWNSYANASIVMLMSYDQWLTTLLHMVAITLPRSECYVLHGPLQLYCWWYFVQYENWRCGLVFVSSHVSEIHMSEADFLWECIIRDSFPTAWLVHAIKCVSDY